MTRAERRREEREAGKDSLVLNGGEVVVAVALSAEHDGTERQYQTFVRGPQTGHRNGQMVELLSMLASTIVLGSAQGGRISVQQSIDECKQIFADNLYAHVRRTLAQGIHARGLKTVQLGEDGRILAAATS